MDFITKRFDRRIRISQSGTKDKQSLLQARIEYLYYFMLGYLWNKQRDSLTKDELIDFVGKLNGKLTIGSIIHTLRNFDKNKELIKDEQAEQVLKAYNQYRNNNIGHGYIFDDEAEKNEDVLVALYNDLLESIPSLKKVMDIVVVQKQEIRDGDSYFAGLIFKADDNGEADPWSCPADMMEPIDFYPQIYYRIDAKYFKISPFVLVEPPDAKSFVFNRIDQKLTGNTIYSKLFESGKVNRNISEFINTSITNEHQRISSNGTVMNRFDTNYHGRYIEVGLTDIVKKFLRDNTSSVYAVLWGNGGVGKTACAQQVCLDLFNDSKAMFEYIVFVTAKDRRLNERTGQIEAIENGLNFQGIINAIYATRYGVPLDCTEDSPKFTEAIEKILQFKGQNEKRALLLVIDDYETFSDGEKAKITEFVRKLNLVHHKVIITTRNRKLADEGLSIPSNALDQANTITFITEKIKQIYPNHSEYFGELSRDPSTRNRIFQATGGVPIFILQWLHLFVQNPTNEELYQRFDTRGEAREFLSGRVYDSLREDARVLYAALSVIAAGDQTFQIERLRYVCEKVLTSIDGFEDALQELENLCIVEQYQIAPDNKAQSLYRVYTKSFLEDMEIKFNGLKDSVRDTIKGRLKSAGGHNTKYSLSESLLIEARQSRGLNSESITVSKYRHIIKLAECPYTQKRQALIELIGYYFSYQDNPDKAIETLRTYEREFDKDPQVLYKYVYYLWGVSDSAYKSVAFEELKKYFVAGLSVTADNVQFFALGAAYYTIYILNSSIENDMELLESACKICQALYSYVSTAENSADIDAINAYQHEIKVALLQAVRLTANLAISENTYAQICEKIGEFFLNNYQNAVLECNSVKKQLSSVKSLTKVNVGLDIQKTAIGSMPDGCVPFIPQYVKYNIDGFPQYLNGMVNDTKGGIAWYDFDKFNLELSSQGGTDAVMNDLIQRGTPIPAVITAISDRGMYSLSIYDTGLALSEVINWKPSTSSDVDSSDQMDATPPEITVIDETQFVSGSIVEFTYTSPYRHRDSRKLLGVFGYIGSEQHKALLHIKQISHRFVRQDEMEKFVEICAKKRTISVKVLRKDSTGTQVDLTDVYPGFDDLLSNMTV